MHFFQLLAVNFCSDALVRFQEAIIANVNCRPPDSHHNPLFMQFQFGKMFGYFVIIKPLSQSFTIVIKDPFFHNKLLFDQEMDHLSSIETEWNTLQNVELFDFHRVQVEPIYQVSSLTNFLVMIWYCWNADPLPETFLWLFDEGFIQQVFSDVGCQLWM